MATAPNDISLLLCGPESAGLIHAVHVQCFDAETGERWREADIRRILALPNALGRLVIEQGPQAHPLGYLLMRWAAEEAEILTIGVAPSERGCGLGHLLVESAEADARRRGVRNLHLEVREDNAVARRLYAAHGFDVVGLRRDYYSGRDGIRRNAVSMSKQLVQGNL